LVPPFAAWRHVLRVDLLAARAGIDGTVLGAPLLVRLDSANFDFSRARSAGQDLRFAKADGTPLPHEIERWDSTGRRAEVWVKVDTLLGGRDDQHILLYAGRDDASDNSSGASVFNAAGGFAGVWHLAEETVGKGSLDLYRDASGLGRHGLDYITDSGRDGIAGFGKHFNGVDDFIALTPSGDYVVRAGQPLTLSAWIKIDSKFNWDSMGGKTPRILEIHQSDSSRPIVALGVKEGGILYYYNKTPVFNATPRPLARDVWHHVCLTVEGLKFKVYQDGEVLLDLQDGSGSLPAGGNLRARIGGNGSLGTAFPGAIDEVRISRVIRSSDWVKFCFRSQSADQKLVVLPP
jgi:hypothetical protein